MTYSIERIAEIDTELREYQKAYNVTTVLIGLEMAKRLKAFRDDRLYLKLDEQSYPNFNRYLESLGLKYKTVMERIGLYEAFVLAGGFTIKELAETSYSKLATIKARLFEKEGDHYLLTSPKKELNKWVEEIKADITTDDLRQRVTEERAGEHEHVFKRITYDVCELCGLKEFKNEKNKN